MNNGNRFFSASAIVLLMASFLPVFSCSDQVSIDTDGSFDASIRRCGPDIGQCRTGEECISGYCVPSGSCHNSADCDGGDCIGGRCVAPQTDAGDVDVDGGADGGYCETDESCDKGYRCNENHACVAAAIISVSPAEPVDFGSVPFGTEKTKDVTVTNIGKLPLSLTGFEIQNPLDNNCFRIVSGGTLATLPENESQVVVVGFRQNDADVETGKLLIGSNDLKKGIYTVLLKNSFKGSPVFTVYDEGGTILVYPKAGAGYELPLDFGLVPTGTIKHLIWTVTNTTPGGDAILALTKLEQVSSGTNTVTLKIRKGKAEDSGDLTPPIYIAAADSVYLHAYYDSKTSVPVDTSSFNLVTNDDDINKSHTPGHNSVVLQFSASSMTSKIDVTPLTINFGEVQKGATLTQPVTISNQGDLDLLIDVTSGLRNSPTWYSLQPDVLARTIKPDDPPFVVQVTFAPTDTKSETNFIDLYTNDPAKPHVEVALDGVGVDPILEVTTDPVPAGEPPVMDLGSVVNGSTLTGKVTVKNTGLTGQIYLESVTVYQGTASVYNITNMKLNGQPQALPIYMKPNCEDVLVFDIEFNSAASGVFPGSMVFKNSDINHKDYTVSMTARSGKANGSGCTVDGDCLNLHCADNMSGTGVCCNLACDRSCQSCKTGTCTVLTSSDYPNNADPKGACPISAQSTCGTKGCKGLEQCDFWDDQTQCAAAVCTQNNSHLKLAVLCNDSHVCAVQTEISCLAYKCDSTANPNVCKTVCYINDDCATGYECDLGSGTPGHCKLASGQVCVNDGDCASNVCCNNSGTKYCRNLTNDPDNCGNCNNVCQHPHGSNPCLVSQCSPSCDAGYSNCSGNTNTGCETDISTFTNSRADAVNASITLTGSGNNTCRSKAWSDVCNPLTSCNQVGEKYDPGTTKSGTRSEWIRGEVRKANNTSNCDMHVGQTFDLTVPAGVSYQLCIYPRDTSSASSGCITVSGGASGYTGSMYLQDVAGFDSSWEYVAEVKYVSGSMCGQWLLKNYGYRCCH